MSENRNDRLAADYREMLKIQNRPYLSWIATKGDPPYAQEYLLNIKLRTYALSAVGDSYIVGAIRRCTVRVTLWDSYPHIAPNIKMLNIPPVFHPDWFSKGTYCPAEPWRPEYSLKEYIVRMLSSLIYASPMEDIAAPANYKALDWYVKNRDNAALFPSDTIVLTENSEADAAALEEAAKTFDELIDSWKIR